MSPIEKSSKLDNVCYDIRGPVLKEAKRLEEEGNKVLKLNIGNPAPFGFEAPDEILVDVIRNLPTAQGYCDSKGLYSARKAIMQHYQARGMRDVTVEDIYIGNGVSELIVQAMQALDRLSIQSETEDILGVKVRKVVLPVAAGRNLAVLVETAVRSYIMQLRGIDGTREFIERHTTMLKGQESNAPDAY